MNTTIPTNAEYEARERADLMATLRDVESAPLADRREARIDWRNALMATAYDSDSNPKQNLVAQRVEWLLNGSYGKGAFDEAWRVVGNKRLNREAILGQLIAALEWRCPNRYAREAWNELDADQQAVVSMGIRREIDHAVKEREEGV